MGQKRSERDQRIGPTELLETTPSLAGELKRGRCVLDLRLAALPLTARDRGAGPALNDEIRLEGGLS